MLNRVTALIADGRWTSPFKLITVDELKDSSVYQAALRNALLNNRPDAELYGWQPINRFAGRNGGRSSAATRSSGTTTRSSGTTL